MLPSEQSKLSSSKSKGLQGVQGRRERGMKIVIDVPEKVYNRFCRCCRFPDEVEEAIIAITDGTVLPEGHGRLIDLNDLYDFDRRKVEYAPTIIEADKAEGSEE
jgi:hypothetical protein